MKLLEKILMAVDFIDKDNKMLVDTTASLSGIFNSEIVLLNVIPDKIENDSVGKYLKKFADENMEKLKSELRQKGAEKVTTMVLKGNPFDRILETAEKDDFNVIIAGSSNKNNHHAPGITVRKLIRKTSVPVWVVKSHKPPRVSGILCPIDFSGASRRALSNAILLASKMKANLRVISVYDPIELVSRRIATDLEDYNKKALASYKKQFEDFLTEFDFQDVPYEIETLTGKPDRIILEELNNDKHDLLLMGTTGKTGISRILVGSVTEKVIEECPVSFITTKFKDILNPEFEMKVASIESLIREAQENMSRGKYQEAARLYEKCIAKNDLFLPAIAGASRAYDMAGNKKIAKQYDQYAKEITTRLWGKEDLKKYIKD